MAQNKSSRVVREEKSSSSLKHDYNAERSAEQFIVLQASLLALQLLLIQFPLVHLPNKTLQKYGYRYSVPARSDSSKVPFLLNSPQP